MDQLKNYSYENISNSKRKTITSYINIKFKN